jgi:hypothetical protein
MSVAAPTIDTRRKPVVVVRFNGYISEPEFDAYLAAMTKVVSGSEKTLTILDARRAIRNPESQQEKQAEWLKHHEERLRRCSLGTAFVITSPLVRSALAAILSLQPLPSEYRVVATMDEAEAWAAKRLAAAGIDVAAVSANRVRTVCCDEPGRRDR